MKGWLETQRSPAQTKGWSETQRSLGETKGWSETQRSLHGWDEGVIGDTALIGVTGLDNGMRGADGTEAHTGDIEIKDEQVKDGTDHNSTST